MTAKFTLGPLTDKIVTTYEVVVKEAPIRDAIRTVTLAANGDYPVANLDLLPAHIRLKGEYDYVIIDCPPSLGMLTLNGLMAAQQVLIPVEPGYFPLIGLGLLHDTITDVARINNLQVLGVIPTMVNRTIEARETTEALQQMFGDKIMPPIPNRVAIRNAHAAQTDIFGFEAGEAAESFAALAREVINRG